MARTKKYIPYLLISPAIATVAVLVFFPLFYSFFLSFSDKDLLISDFNLIGLSNYARTLQDPDFAASAINGTIYALGTTVATLGLGLLFALLLNQDIKQKGVITGLFLFPYIVPTVAAVFSFKWVLHGTLGIVNYLGQSLGILGGPVAFFSSMETAMASVVMVTTWKLYPFMLITILARLQTIPTYLYDAAKVDGASTLRQFWHITIPQLKTVLFIATILRFVWTFNFFDSVWLLTGGGPVKSTQTVPIFIYLQVFKRYDVGLGTATAIVSFTFLLICYLIYVKIYKVGV